MNYRTERWPVVTFSLMGLNVLIWLATFICSVSTDGDSNAWVYGHLWLAPATSPFYAWLSSMFVHAGPAHLLGNMLFLFLFGCCVEDMIGRRRFLLFYLLGGFVAELAFFATTPRHFASTIPLGGASGAISACMGMFLWLRADVEIEFLYFYWFFGPRAGRFEVSAKVAIGLWFLKDLFWLIMSMAYPHVFGGGVAVGAHVGGILAGVAMLAACRISAPQPPEEPALPKMQNVREAIAEANRKILAGQIAKTAAPPEPLPPPKPEPLLNYEPRTIFLSENGVQTGPHTLTHIQTRLAKHDLAVDSLYWSDGMSAWSPVRELAPGPLG